MYTACIKKTPRSFGDLSRIADTDASRDSDLRSLRSRINPNHRTRKIHAVVCARDAERTCEPAGTVGAKARHDSADWLDRANEHGMSLPFAQRDDVEALVHSVDEKDVGACWRPEKRARSRCEPEPRVACGVVRSAIRLRFDDASDAPFTANFRDEMRADERTRDDPCVAFEERSR